MVNNQDLNDKRILVVDDEPDILETLEELLEDTFVVDPASSFEEAVSFLKNNTYDVAILDIMGVRGYDLLEATHTLGIPSLMLTAHALSPDNLKKSIELGADAYIPKDKMVDISLYVEDVLLSRQDKRKNNFKWYTKLRPLFDDFFGEGWKDPEKQFWDAFDKKHLEPQ
ncbi:MAG: response regulator [Desulfobacterales bacterium]|nr:response regulator [Desulfobacterales bacterium]